MLTIHLFGKVQLDLDGRPLPSLPSRKAEALLAYLASQPRPLPRETLATIFWDESSPDQAMANLRKLLSTVRKQVGEYLVVDRQSVTLNANAGVWLDTAEFANLLPKSERINDEEMEALRTAVSLYRDDFLACLHLPDSRDFEAWATLERERLKHQFAEALRALIQHDLQRRDYQAGLHYARQLLALDPLSEYAHRQLMLLLARSGQTEAALAQYETCAQILAQELGVAPTQQTIAWRERIETAALHTTELPEQIGLFVGRETEIAGIHQDLDDRDCRLLTLVGPGGIGKTRLSLQVAAERAVDYLHGVHFVPLAALDLTSSLASAIADALNMSLAGIEPLERQLLDYLQSKEMLLVLDNCETLLTPDLVESADFLSELWQKCPQVSILATSRERFNFQVERVMAIFGLPYADADDPTALTPAMRLFAARAKEAQAEFFLSPEIKSDVTRICHLVEGSPLGIELAAAAVTRHDVAAIAAELTANLDFLGQEALDRHQSLRAVFASSWTHLSIAEQAVFQQLSIFRTSFTVEAATNIAAAMYTDLLSLVDKSMLRLMENGRYTMHELLRWYAAEKLAADEAAAMIAHQRHAAYYTQLVQQLEPELVGFGVGDALTAMRAEIENVRQAWHWAVTQHEVEAIRRCLPGLSRYYQLRGPFQEGVAIFDAAVTHLHDWITGNDAAGTAGYGLLVDLLVQRALFLNEQSLYHEAIDDVWAAAELAPKHGITSPTAHLEWGRALVGQGDYDAAQTQLETAVSLAQTYQAPLIEAESLRILGIIAHYQGEYDRASDLFAQALQTQRRLGNRWAESGLLNNLGIVAKSLGNLQEARAYYEQNLQIADEIGDRRGRSKALVNLGVVLRNLGDFAGAIARYERALRLKRELGERQGESLVLNNLGNIFAQQGDYETARTYFEQALQLYEALGRRRDKGMVHSNLGLLAHLLGDDDTAVSHSRHALHIAQEVGDRPTQAFALTHMAHGLLALSHLDAAGEAYQQALTLRQEMGEVLLVLESQAGLARVALAQDDLAAAQAWIEPILPYLENNQIGGSEQPFRVYLTCYLVLAANGDGRAAGVITAAYKNLQDQAAQIAEETMRHHFLENVAIHRQIVAVYTQEQVG